METTMNMFEVNGIFLHYYKSGKGKPVVFIPGSISDYRTWTNIVQILSEYFTCYVVSRRYQYPSTFIDGADSSVAINTEDIASFLKSQFDEPVDVVGHSFGGFIALNLAIQYPYLVRSIVAEEPVFVPVLLKNPDNPLQILSLCFKDLKVAKSFIRLGTKGINPAFKALRLKEFDKAKTYFIDGVTGGTKTKETLDELTKKQLNDNIYSLEGENPFNNTIEKSDASKIKCPVYLISGDKSIFVFQYINRELQSLIANCKSENVQNSGHWIHIDQPEEYCNQIKAFLT